MPCPPRPTRAVVPLLAVSLVALPLPLQAEDTIRCTSHGLRYKYCRVDTDNRVELVREHGLFDCKRDRSWGYDRHGVWVDSGCDGDFRVGRSGGKHDKALAVGALVGLAAIAAIASSKHEQEQKKEEVEGWAVGSFSGYDSVERTQVQLTILPGGTVNGRAGSTGFGGSLKGMLLEAGRHRFRVERSGNGFIATDERDPAHRVSFVRTTSGY